MLYTTRAISEALSVSMSTVRNDVARGVLKIYRNDLYVGNRFTHKEVMEYYRYRLAIRRKDRKKIPPLLTVLRILRRCTGYQLSKVYGLRITAKHLGMKLNTLARNNSNYRLWRAKQKAKLVARTEAINGQQEATH